MDCMHWNDPTRPPYLREQCKQPAAKRASLANCWPRTSSLATPVRARKSTWKFITNVCPADPLWPLQAPATERPTGRQVSLPVHLPLSVCLSRSLARSLYCGSQSTPPSDSRRPARWKRKSQIESYWRFYSNLIEFPTRGQIPADSPELARHSSRRRRLAYRRDKLDSR